MSETIPLSQTHALIDVNFGHFKANRKLQSCLVQWILRNGCVGYSQCCTRILMGVIADVFILCCKSFECGTCRHDTTHMDNM